MATPSPGSLEIRNIGTLATPLGTTRWRGPEQGEIRPRLSGAAIRAEHGKLVFVGSEKDYARAYSGKPAEQTLDAAGRAVIPGLVDAHTHPVWLGDRGPEIGRRLAGDSYAKIAAEGGGINATVRATRAGSDAELEAAVRARLATMLAHGTTTVEAKSGYGLTEADELKALRILGALEGPDAAADRPDAPGRARDPSGVSRAARGVGAPGGRRHRSPGRARGSREVLRRVLRGGSLHRPGDSANPGGRAAEPDSVSGSTPTSSHARAGLGWPRSSRRRPPTTSCSSRPRRSPRSRGRAPSPSSCRARPGGCARDGRPPGR